VNGGVASSTRGVFAGGVYSGTDDDEIEYITIATTGNVTDFGDLLKAAYKGAGCSTDVRGVWALGYNGDIDMDALDTIEYITIDTTGNSTDFGNLSVKLYRTAGLSGTTRGVFAGGIPSVTDVIQYITIATTANTTDFGDLINAKYGMAGSSGG